MLILNYIIPNYVSYLFSKKLILLIFLSSTFLNFSLIQIVRSLFASTLSGEILLSSVSIGTMIIKIMIKAMITRNI